MRNRWPRRARVLGITLGLLLLLRVFAPLVVAWRIEYLLAERIHTDVEITELDLDLLEPGLVATDVHTTEEGASAVTSLTIERLELTWQWSTILRLSPRAHVTVVKPHVVLDLDASRSKVTDMKGLELTRLSALEITGGSVDVTIETHSGRSRLPIHDIEFELESTDWDAGRHAEIELDASLGDAGSLIGSGLLSTVDVAEDWSVEFALKDFDVATLNLVWVDMLEMDVDRGTLDIKGRLRRRRDRLKGFLKPHFKDLVFLGADESARHGIGEALFQHMLARADSRIEIDRRIGAGTGATLEELFATDWEALIAGLIQRGYSRRLSSLVGFNAEIADVEVHFDEGLIVLKEIVLARDSRRVPAPFLTIKRLEVRFDPEVTDVDAEAFKHVVIWEPELTFVKGFDDARSQLRFDPDWVDKISAMPFKTRDLVVHDGTIAYWDETATEKIRFFVSDVELVGTEMAKDLHEKGTRWATLSVQGKAEGVGATTVVVAYEPGDVANAEVTFSMEPVPFEAFEPLLRSKVGIEVLGGKFGVSGRVEAANYHVDATLRPQIFGVNLHNVDEDRPGRAFTRKLLERRLRRLGARTLEISYDYKPDEKAFGTFTSRLIHVAVRQTKRRSFFGASP